MVSFVDIWLTWHRLSCQRTLWTASYYYCMSSKCWKSFNEELFLEIFLEAIGNFWGLTSSQRLWQSSYDLRDWVSKIIKNVWWEGGRSQILLNFSFSWQPYQSISFSWRHSMVSAIYAICTVGPNLQKLKIKLSLL